MYDYRMIGVIDDYHSREGENKPENFVELYLDS